MHARALICRHDLIKMQSYVPSELNTILHSNISDTDAALLGILFIHVLLLFGNYIACRSGGASDF